MLKTSIPGVSRHRRSLVAVVLGGLGLALIAGVTIGVGANASGGEIGPTPESVIADLASPTSVELSLSDEAREAASDVDAELGIPHVARMLMLDEGKDTLTVAFPIGDDGICLLRQIQVGREMHIIRTCAPTTAIAARGLPLRVQIAPDDGGIPFDETVILVPDGYVDLMFGGTRVGAIRNNLALLPKVGTSNRPFSAQGPSGIIELGSLSD